MMMRFETDLVDAANGSNLSGTTTKVPRCEQDGYAVSRYVNVTDQYPSTPAGRGVFDFVVDLKTYSAMLSDPNYKAIK